MGWNIGQTILMVGINLAGVVLLMLGMLCFLSKSNTDNPADMIRKSIVFIITGTIVMFAGLIIFMLIT